jgi:hypothetical protein
MYGHSVVKIIFLNWRSALQRLLTATNARYRRANFKIDKCFVT